MMSTTGRDWTFQLETIVTPSAKNKEPTLADAMGIHTIGLRCMNKHRPGHLHAPTYEGYFDLSLNRRSFKATSNRHIHNNYTVQFPENNGFIVQEISHVVFFNTQRFISLVCGLYGTIRMEVGDTITFAKGKINFYIYK